MYLVKNYKSGINLGMSVAFSWGTANIMIMGMALVQEKGLLDFLFWAVPNTLVIFFFGLAFHKGWLKAQALDNKLVKIGLLYLQYTMLLFQLKLLQNYFAPFFDTPYYSIILASVVAGIFVLWMLKGGLRTSIETDNWQGWITIVTLSLAIAYCIITQVPTYDINLLSATPNWAWMAWSVVVLIAAIISDLQQWRRVQIDETGTAYIWGTVFFGLTIGLCGILACFQIPFEVRLFCIIPILGLATSTIDSMAVAVHECFNKWVGTSIAMIIVCFWWQILDSSVIQFWNYFGAIRITVAAIICVLSFKIWYDLRRSTTLQMA